MSSGEVTMRNPKAEAHACVCPWFCVPNMEVLERLCSQVHGKSLSSSRKRGAAFFRPRALLRDDVAKEWLGRTSVCACTRPARSSEDASRFKIWRDLCRVKRGMNFFSSTEMVACSFWFKGGMDPRAKEAIRKAMQSLKTRYEEEKQFGEEFMRAPAAGNDKLPAPLVASNDKPLVAGNDKLPAAGYDKLPATGNDKLPGPEEEEMHVAAVEDEEDEVVEIVDENKQ